jgi:hypothetical protein
MASENGCPIEFHRIDVNKCDKIFDQDCMGNKFIPFLRADYDRQTGHSPNSPREQVRLCCDIIKRDYLEYFHAFYQLQLSVVYSKENILFLKYHAQNYFQNEKNSYLLR